MLNNNFLNMQVPLKYWKYAKYIQFYFGVSIFPQVAVMFSNAAWELNSPQI